MGMGLAGMVGLGGALAGMFGGNTASSVPIPQMPQAPNMVPAANSAFSGANNINQTFTPFATGTLPTAQNILSTQQNNPFASMALGGAQTGAGLGQNAALTSFAGGQNLTGASMAALPFAQTILGTAMDPQTALYNRTLQQVTDQTRAGLEARGMDNTPYGAGVEGQTLSNFNIDWQNNLLNRMSTGAGAAGNLINAAGGGINTGAGVANAAGGQYFGASALPYGAFLGQGTDQFNMLNSALGVGSNAGNLANLGTQDLFNYLSSGNAMNQSALQQAQLGLNQNALNFNQNMQLGNMLGSSLALLGRSPTLGSGYNPSAFGGQGSLFGYSLNPSFGFG